MLSDIQAFLLERIVTHEALRTASWLVHHADASVTTAELAKNLGLRDVDVQEALDELVEADLVFREGCAPQQYQYRLRDPELDGRLRRTVLFFEQNKLEVARALAANSIGRLRSMAYRAYGALLKGAIANGGERERSVNSSAATSCAAEVRYPEPENS